MLGFVVGMVRSVDIDKHSSVVSQTILRILKAIIAVYVEVIRGTPLMVQATVIYYGTMSIWGLDIPSFSAGILALSLHIGAYFSESERGAIGGIDKGQMEGGQAIGMMLSADHAACHHPAGVPEPDPADRQHICICHQGYFRIKRYRCYRAVFHSPYCNRELTTSSFETYCIVSVIYFVCTFVISPSAEAA